MLTLNDAAIALGFRAVCARISPPKLVQNSFPCILHWNQNHFVVLYKVSKGKKFYVADPGKGLVKYNLEEFKSHWISTRSNGEEKGIAMFLEPTPTFYSHKEDGESGEYKNPRSFRFLFGYVKKYKRYFGQVVLGMVVGSLLQLVLPFLTQSIVDVGIKNQNLGFIWLILLGQLMLTFSRTAIDFIRRWLLLHISMRVNISLVSDFFIKLLKLPMSFFDTKLMGDLMQRMNDHSRVNNFLTNQALSVTFAMLTFVVFTVVLFLYNRLIFVIFLAGSLLYGLWMTLFLRRRKVLDYELFEQQAINNNKTYEFITSMQEIKLQDCEQRRRWEWEDTQVDGGEFFLYPRWQELLEKLKGCNYLPEIISTKYPMDIDMIKDFSKFGINLQVSFDSVAQDTLDNMVGRINNYSARMQAALKNIDQVMSFQVATILTKYNGSIQEMEKMYTFLSTLHNVRRWEVRVGFKSLYSKKKFEDIQISRSSIEEIQHWIKDKQSSSKFEILWSPGKEVSFFKAKHGSADFVGSLCSANSLHMFILPDGKVTICEQLYWNKNFLIGDLAKMSISEVWNSPRALYLAHRQQNDYSSDSYCHKCKIFDTCKANLNDCFPNIMKVYGKEHWDYPDPRCDKAPRNISDKIYV